MTIAQSVCTVGKIALLTPLTTAVLKMALYTSAASLGADTTVYTTTGETTGTGYTAGGKTLTNVTVVSGNGIAWLTFDNPTWTGASFTALGALIYNSSDSDTAIAVVNFGEDKTASATTFVVQLPDSTSTTALIRIV